MLLDRMSPFLYRAPRSFRSYFSSRDASDSHCHLYLSRLSRTIGLAKSKHDEMMLFECVLNPIIFQMGLILGIILGGTGF